MAFSNRPMRRSALIGPWGVGAIVPLQILCWSESGIWE